MDEVVWCCEEVRARVWMGWERKNQRAGGLYRNPRTTQETITWVDPPFPPHNTPNTPTRHPPPTHLRPEEGVRKARPRQVELDLPRVVAVGHCVLLH